MYVIGDMTRLNARRYPDRDALIMDGKHLTYGQLNQQVNQLAHGLISLGVKTGDRVAILAFNCLECVVVNFAVAKCGAVVVPLNFRYKKGELIYAINNSEPKVLLHGPEFNSILEEASKEFLSQIQLIAISGEPLSGGKPLSGLMNGKSKSEPGVNVDPNSPLTITYTSGTTGNPKGVLASHSAFLSIYQGMAMEGDLGSEEITLVALPLFHTAGMHALISPTFLRGGTAIIMGAGFDPDKILGTVERYRVTLTMWVPTMLAMLVNHPGAAKYDTSSLTKIWYGSSPISPTIFEASNALFKADFYQWYGQTETGMVSVLRPEDHPKHSQCTGREIYNSTLRIVDINGEDVAVGGIGEIVSAQKPLGMISYHKMEDATKETIRKGWIHTGDVARVEGDGFFTIVDRMKDMIISGAENIYPKEIEDTIMAHPSVLEVAVIGVPDEIYGESVCAVVVAKKGQEIGPEDVIQFCANRLSSYKKPKKVVFMNELPKNAGGKVTKNVLREPFWAGRKKRI
jgi:acyl-CoA synthetase (AMP-forming)/AMP-acid ligase II